MIKRYTLDPEMFALVANEDGEVVDYNDHLAAIQAAKVVTEIESYKRTMKMQIPDWLSHKLAQEVKRCEDLLTQLNKEKCDV